MKDYLSFTRQFFKHHPPTDGPVRKDNITGRLKKSSPDEIEVEGNKQHFSSSFSDVVID